MIEQSMLDAVKQYTANLPKKVTLVLATGEHQKRAELHEFLSDLVSASDKLELIEKDFDGARSPISFSIESDGTPTGIIISGIPGGHEFTTLVLAILQVGGTPLKLDENIQALIKNVKQPLQFQTFVSLSCTNCPDVMQTLNQFALLNPLISSEMIEGGVFPELIKKYDIQGVPSVFLNGEAFNDGRVEASRLLNKLLDKYPEITEGVKQETSLPLQDVTVIGGGPAGASAAIYAARKGLKVTIVADRIGGQVLDTNGIENLIGTKETTGPELGNQLLEHLKVYPITLKEKLSVKEVQAGAATHKIVLSTGEVIETKTLIIASGANWKTLGVPGEVEYMGKGVAYCPHCDGPFFKGKPVAVVGGGNSGVEAALDLSGIVKEVTLIHRSDCLKADKVLIDAVEQRPNIHVITNALTQSIEAKDGHVAGIRYKNRQTGELRTIDLDAVFVQIGLLPNTEFLADVVKKNSFGEIEIDDHCRTSVPGIFAAGDCTTVPYKQIIISMGEGSKASLAAFEYLIRH